MKLGVVDVGGGLRGIYAAGVFDYCIDMGIHFDVCIGVSAGAANVASYMAGQRGRNYKFYIDYARRRQYMSLINFLFKKTYIDLDYVYGKLSNTGGENPLDYTAMVKNPGEILVVATEAETGEAKYFDKRDFRQDEYSVLKASSAIPFICKPYMVDGIAYFDGGLSDPVPIEKAFDCGCDKVVLILTKPKGMLPPSRSDRELAHGIRRRYPLASEKLYHRMEAYNRGLSIAQKLEKKGKVLIIAPDDTCGVETLTRNKVLQDRFYKKGYEDGKKIKAFLKDAQTQEN